MTKKKTKNLQSLLIYISIISCIQLFGVNSVFLLIWSLSTTAVSEIDVNYNVCAWTHLQMSNGVGDSFP